MAIFSKAKYFRLAKGFYGKGGNCWRIVRNRVEKALQHSYVGRKNRARNMRSLFIVRINAASRTHGLSYSQLAHALNMSSMVINTKMLATLARWEPASFEAVVRNAASIASVKPRPQPRLGYIDTRVVWQRPDNHQRVARKERLQNLAAEHARQAELQEKAAQAGAAP
jgi:large subunit ribosomal protein L20